MAPLHTERLVNQGSDKTPLIMLHGWGVTLESLKPLGQLLSPYTDVHLIDLPGFGQSPAPDTIWDSFQYADRIIAYLNENQIDQIDLLGHSFGGKVSLSLASRYPDRVRHLILMAASGMRRRRTFPQRCRLHAIKWLGKSIKKIDSLFGTSLFAQRFSSRFGSADYKAADSAMRPILVRSVNEDLSEQISTITAPTVMLWGDQDNETPVEVAQRMHKLIRNSHLIIIPGKGHWLYQDVGCHLCAHHILSALKMFTKDKQEI